MDSDKSYMIPFEDLQDVRPIQKFGSAAVIHKALWKSQNNRQVAIKIYNKLPQDKEVNILKKLDHPNIIKFYGILKAQLSSGIVIEYALGGDLLSFLASKRKEKVGVRLPRRQFTHWCLDISAAIQYLHEHHIIHKDIKSPNVLISGDIIYEEDEEPLNRLKICDFGISKELTSTESVISSCYGGCTRSWAAPEVIKDHRLVSQKSDIYSLCVVFWELWTCQQPWSDHLDHDIETKVKQGIFLQIPTDLPEVMKKMILKCWQVERHKRCGIDDVIACIECLMSKWQIKVCQDNKVGNQEISKGGAISEEIVKQEKSVQRQTRLEHQKYDKIPVRLIQNKHQVEQTFRPIETEWVDATEKSHKTSDYNKKEYTKINYDDVRPDLDDSDIYYTTTTELQDEYQDILEYINIQNEPKDIQTASNYKEEEEYTKINDDDVDLDHDDSEIYYTPPPSDLQYYYNQKIPVYDNKQSELMETRCPIVDSKSEESLQVRKEGVESLTIQASGVEFSAKQATEHAAGLNKDWFFEKGKVGYIVNHFERLDEHGTTSLRRKIAVIEDTVNNENNYEPDEYPSTIERNDVTPMSSLPATYQHLISPVPKIADCYDKFDGTCVPLTGKSGEELTKLYEHVEKSYTDLKHVKEECIDNNRFHGVLNDGELRHLLTNISDVESTMSRIYTWFNQCRWQISAICQLILNILKGRYLQPFINFKIYSQIQMNILKCIRNRHVDFAEIFTRDSEDMNYKLSFRDFKEILLKQANWLKKFYSILKNLYYALVIENIEDTPMLKELKECCCKLDQIVLKCNEDEGCIIRDIQHHSTSILQKLRFESVNEKEKQSQKAIISNESWVKKIGTIYLLEDIKQNKRQSVIAEKKCKMMAFVSTVVIAEDKGEYLRVIECIHKNNIKLERKGYQNMDCTSGVTLMLTKLDPHTKLHVKEYEITLEDRCCHEMMFSKNEILEWTEALEFSEAEKQSQDREYITPMYVRLSTSAVTEPTYEEYYKTTYAQLKKIYENVEAIQVLASINTLNKMMIESMSKLIEWYIDDAVLSTIIRKGERHHLYLNVQEVNEVIKSFNRCIETKQYDSFHLFNELKKHLDNDSFYPVIKYQAHLCFQKNMLQFQRKHSTAFSHRLGDLEKDPNSKWRVSEMDLLDRLSKPDNWLTKLYLKLKSLEAAITRDSDHQEIFHRLNENTLQMLDQLILRGQDLKKSVAQRFSSHFTSLLLKLPTETINEPHLIRKLSNIQDDWIQKHDRMTLYTKRKKDLVNPWKKRYRSTQINLYVFTSAIILTSSLDETVENPRTDRFCYCYDRNYVDMDIVDANSRETWMPESENLFKLWIYEKEDAEYKQHEFVIGLNANESKDDLLKWKSALVVATGESGIFDEYRRPSHIVIESFVTDRKGELHIEIDDIVEILEMQYARDETWIKGMRLSDKKTGWFPSNKLGNDVESEYNIGQEVKLRYRKERERERKSDDQGCQRSRLYTI